MNELIGILIHLFPRNSNNISRCSTNIEENNENNNNNNDVQKTRNIIIENKKEYSIDVDIKNYSVNKDGRLSHSKSINLEQIKFDFIINSEENKINNNIENEENKNNI